MSFFVSIAIIGLLVAFFVLVAIFSASDDPTPRVAARRLPRVDDERATEKHGVANESPE